MAGQGRSRIRTAARGLAQGLRKPEALVFLPALTVGGYWMGGEAALVAAALGLPVALALAEMLRAPLARTAAAQAALPAAATRPQIVAALDAVLRGAGETGLTTGCLVVQIDDAGPFLDRHGRAAQTEVLAQSAGRIGSLLRQGDAVAALEGGGFAVALRAQRRIDVEALVQIAARLQAALAVPVSLGATRLYVTASVGFCHAAAAPQRSGTALLEAAQIAADDALRNGPGAIRAFAPTMARHRADRDAQRETLEAALDSGEFRAHFQPQVCTDTGALSGFEALARWHHPERGLVPPADFLPAIEEAGLSERLGEVMLHQALSALTRWDAAGLRVPAVGVNFSAAELRNPRLAETLSWEVDRFGLTPDRLSVEILETVVAGTDNDIVVRTIAALAERGFGIDLDDFGTGHASIANIRRFAVRRIKIDRSFVASVDRDREQQRVISAVVSMADRLGLDTLAEGVETAAEHAMLAQLGCRHVQGYGIARPMPLDDTLPWIEAALARRVEPPRIGRRLR